MRFALRGSARFGLGALVVHLLACSGGEETASDASGDGTTPGGAMVSPAGQNDATSSEAVPMGSTDAMVAVGEVSDEGSAVEPTGTGASNGAAAPSATTAGPDGPETGAAAAPAIALSLPMEEGCAIEGDGIDRPMMSSGHPVDRNGPTALITDGVDASVACRYLGDPQARVDVQTSNGNGGLSLAFTVDILNQQDGRVLCALTLTPAVNRSTKSYEGNECTCELVAMGELSGLIEVTCPDFGAEDRSENCPVNEGYVYFENCTWVGH